MQNKEPILSIQGVSKTYANGVRALNNISLTIPSGMYGLLGPNGAGKSTLMRTLATLQDPDEGEIMFEGLSVDGHKSIVRQNLGYLPQEFGVYKDISAEKLLMHFIILKGIHGKHVRAELSETL